MIKSQAMLTIWRRHTAECPHRDKGRDYLKCNCPIWADGYVNGQRTLRHSLKTRDMARARKRAAELEDPKAPLVKPITAYKNHILSLTSRTQDRYKSAVDHLAAYCSEVGLEDMSQITIEHLDRYRASLKLAPTTLNKELSILRQFLGFCFERRWIVENPGKNIKLARNIKPTEKVPYTPGEVAKMLAACDIIGNSRYERLRSRAAILLLRYTGLRISDLATLERKRIQNGKILLYTQKTGGTVFLPIPESCNGLWTRYRVREARRFRPRTSFGTASAMPRRWLAASHARWQPCLNGQAFKALTLTDSGTR
jgi:site-specific recombinase XerD